MKNNDQIRSQFYWAAVTCADCDLIGALEFNKSKINFYIISIIGS